MFCPLQHPTCLAGFDLQLHPPPRYPERRPTSGGACRWKHQGHAIGNSTNDSTIREASGLSRRRALSSEEAPGLTKRSTLLLRLRIGFCSAGWSRPYSYSTLALHESIWAKDSGLRTATTYLAHQGREGNFEIGRILHLKSEIPKSQIGRASLNGQQSNLRFRDFGFEMQDSSNFKISLSALVSQVCCYRSEPGSLLLQRSLLRETILR